MCVVLYIIGFSLVLLQCVYNVLMGDLVEAHTCWVNEKHCSAKPLARFSLRTQERRYTDAYTCPHKLHARANELLNQWSSDPVNCWTTDPLNQWSSELLNYWSSDPVIQWTAEPLIQWTSDPVNCCTSGLIDYEHDTSHAITCPTRNTNGFSVT